MNEWSWGFLAGYSSAVAGMVLGVLVSWWVLRRLDRITRDMKRPRARRARFPPGELRRVRELERERLRLVRDEDVN